MKMKTSRRADRRPAADGREPIDVRRMREDPDYLAFKESIGEPLAESERRILDAHRQAAHYLSHPDAGGRPPGGDAP